MTDKKETPRMAGGLQEILNGPFDKSHDREDGTDLRARQGVDTLTTLTATGPLRMCKRWLPNGDAETYGNAKNMKHQTFKVGGIYDLSRELFRLSTEQQSCLIRGGYIGDELAVPLMRTEDGWTHGCVLRRETVFKDRALHSVMIDIDEFIPSVGCPTVQPVACIDEFIAKHLPACFHGITYHWQLSNGAGLLKNEGRLKAHVWFWLETAYTGAELTAWCRVSARAIDETVFRAIQPLYTSNPAMSPGMTDPIARRSGLAEGLFGDKVALVIQPEILSGGRSSGGAKELNEEIQTAVANDPTAQRLYERSMVRGVLPRGALNIVCPRENEHAEEQTGPTSCIYFPAHTGGYKTGTFKCLHKHCAGAPQQQFLEALGIDDAAEGFEDVETVEAPAVQSDVKIARLLAALLQKQGFVFEHGGRGWMIYRAGVYRPCALGEATEAAKSLGAEMMKSAPAAAPDAFKRTMGLAQRAMSAAGINAALHLAESDPRLAVGAATFDKDPDILNVLNGVVHLPTGELRPHDPAQFLSRQCPVVYDASAPAGAWDRFLQEISNNDPDWVDFLQRAIGYSMSGHVNEEVLFFLLGVGANGKSVFCNVVRRIIGTYGGAVPANFLMVSKRDGESATPSLATLPGARIVQANEVEAGARLSAQTVKVATSTDAISARHLYGRQFTFTPTHTLWIRGNHKPIITDNDEGIWRRVVLIPFDRHFSADEKDVGIEEKIMQEAPGVLAWMVRGCLAYHRQGLRRARRVAAASQAYRAESDLVGQWIDERAVRAPVGAWPQNEAYIDYRNWCSEQGLHPMAKKSLTSALLERGFGGGQETTGGRRRTYRGLTSATICTFEGERANTAAQDAQDYGSFFIKSA
jgi:putative DNA primase/helicase